DGLCRGVGRERAVRLGQYHTMAGDISAVVEKIGVRIERTGQARCIRAPDISQSIHIEIGDAGSTPCGEQCSLRVGQVREISSKFKCRRVRDQALQLSKRALLKAVE